MKKILILIILLALAGGGYYYYQSQQSKVEVSNLAASNGRLELKRIDLQSLYAGRVKTVAVEEGQYVHVNDLIAELASETSTSQVDQAKANKQKAQETIARAQADIQAAQQQQKVAQLELDNALKLRKDGLVSASEVARRQADRDAAVAKVKSATASLAEIQRNVEVAETQIAQATSVTDDMIIRTPYAGVIEYRFVDEGNVVAAGSRVASLLDPTDVSMYIFVPATDMAKVKVGDEARIVLDGVEAVFPAVVSQIATQSQFTPKSVETLAERTKFMFKIKLKVPADVATKYQGLLKGGMAGNGYVRLDNSDWASHLAVKLPQE
ncbi:HlyD family secretion protein [Lonepinella sp. BR2271]|uniref:HlyD family secretion protein n=1 Tax=Lonepinella sp. BR2271 TaxID=3434550 RepID=UPI003F6DE8B2